MTTHGLAVAARGMCCALGWYAPAAVAAIRARLNHFRASEFVARDGQPIVAASAYGLNTWGVERLGAMLRSSVLECLADARNSGAAMDTSRTALLLMLPEPGRPALQEEALAELFQDLVAELGLSPESQLGWVGQGGLALALQTGEELIHPTAHGQRGVVDAVLLAAVDSLLDAPLIESLLNRQRLACDGRTDALVPGEGSAAILLMDSPPPDRLGMAFHTGLRIDAWAHAIDPWRMDGDLPLQAKGLTQVLRGAAAAAGRDLADFEFHVSGANGEEWYAREIQMALSRAMQRRRPSFPHQMLAHLLGETGTAAPVMALAWLSLALPQNHRGFGRCGLVHFAGDDGQRSAAAVSLDPTIAS